MQLAGILKQEQILVLFYLPSSSFGLLSFRVQALLCNHHVHKAEVTKTNLQHMTPDLQNSIKCLGLTVKL